MERTYRKRNKLNLLGTTKKERNTQVSSTSSRENKRKEKREDPRSPNLTSDLPSPSPLTSPESTPQTPPKTPSPYSPPSRKTPEAHGTAVPQPHHHLLFLQFQFHLKFQLQPHAGPSPDPQDTDTAAGGRPRRGRRCPASRRRSARSGRCRSSGPARGWQCGRGGRARGMMRAVKGMNLDPCLEGFGRQIRRLLGVRVLMGVWFAPLMLHQ